MVCIYYLPIAFGVISSSCSSYSSEEIILDNLCCLAWLKLEFEEASSKSRSVDKKCRLFLLTWCIVEVLAHEDNIIGVNIQLFLLFKSLSTMVSVSTVQPSINLEFPCTYKNLKMSLYTLFKKLQSTDFHIWKVMHEITVKWWKNSCRPMESPYFLRVESPLWLNAF